MIIKERKKTIALLVIVVMLLAGGVGLGYYIWGMEKQEKPDYKKYLDKTIDYIAKIENANQTLIKQSKNSKTDISLLKKKIKEGQEHLEAQVKTLQAKLVSIQNELDKSKALLQPSLNENKKLVFERNQLKERVQELVNELDIKKKSLQSSLNENEKLVLENDQLKALVLEKERLKARIKELIHELDTFKQKTADIKPEAGPQESPVKEQDHPEMESHQTESMPLIEQEQVNTEKNEHRTLNIERWTGKDKETEFNKPELLDDITGNRRIVYQNDWKETEMVIQGLALLFYSILK